MDALAISVKKQLPTNQNSLQQMIQEQRDHLDAKIIVLLGSIKNMCATTEKNSNEIIAIQNQFGANSVDLTTNAKSTGIWTLSQ
eukprot:3881352-Ditylum_brightwellii.AAC.1